MRKAKRGPALFELLKDEEVSGDGPPKPAATTRPPRLREKQAEVATPSLFTRESPPSKAATKPTVPEDGERPPVIELDGERIRISLTSVSAAVVLFVTLVVLVVVFEIGRQRGESTGIAEGYRAGRASYAADAFSEIEAARAQPPVKELVSDLLREPVGGVDPAASAPSSEATGPRWVRGHTYVVVQEFMAGRDADAEKAKAFLLQHGVETAAVKRSGGSVQLITTKGFNRSEPAQHQMADEFRRKIHTIGASYFASGGGYKLEGYFKKLTNDQW